MRRNHSALIFLTFIVYISNHCADSYFIKGSLSDTDYSSLDRLSRINQNRYLLIELLRQINSLTKGSPDVRNDNSIPEDDTGYTDVDRTRIRSKKRDMGIMPPWREFCRLAGLSYCRGSSS